MKRHRILLVVRYPVGGIRTFFRYVYKNFDAKKYHFTLVAPDLPETRMLLEDLKGLDLSYEPTEKDVTNRTLFRIASRLIRNGSFDLVHSHGYTAGVCSIVGALWTRTPHILTCHEVLTDGQFVGLLGVVKKVVLGIILLMIDCIHCVSHDARANLLASLPILKLFKRNVIVIHNGIEVSRFLYAETRDLRRELELPPSTFLIGFLGRFMSPKGFKYLVAALGEIVKKRDLPRLPVLLCFGEDGFMREERDEVKKLGLAEAVYFLPFVGDVGPTLKGLDVIAIPSLWEACPLLPMEAMVAGIPVIGTDCVGLREVLRDTPATVVSTRDSVGLAAALVMEMKTPTKAKTSNFSLKAAARFNVNERAVEFENLMLRQLK